MTAAKTTVPAAPGAPDTTAPAPDANGPDTGAPAAPDAPAAPVVSDDTKDARIAALEAQLAAGQAQGFLSQIQQAQQPAPATFAAPSAELIGKQDSLTGLVQNLPQKLWDQLAPEDQERFTDISTQPAKPADTL